jgi:hypothetical protein
VRAKGTHTCAGRTRGRRRRSPGRRRRGVGDDKQAPAVSLSGAAQAGRKAGWRRPRPEGLLGCAVLSKLGRGRKRQPAVLPGWRAAGLGYCGLLG